MFFLGRLKRDEELARPVVLALRLFFQHISSVSCLLFVVADDHRVERSASVR